MKKLVLCITAVLCLWQVTPAQQRNTVQSTGKVAGAPPGVKPSSSKATPMGFIHPKRNIKNNTDSYSATTFTFSDITVFSYFDNTVVTIVDSYGNTVGTDSMKADTLYSITPGQGIYTINGNKPYSVLIGDAITNYVNGYFALDQSGRGLSTKLNTWMMASIYGYDPHFIIFAYQDGTQFTLKDLQTGSILYAGTLNAGEHYDYPDITGISDKAVQVVSNEPVSALSYTDQDYYVPSANGLFAGNLFYGFSGYSGSWENSITLTSYADNNNVVVTNVNTGDTLLVKTLGLWQVTTVPIFQDTFWKVVSSGIVTAADIPFAGYTGSYYYMARSADSTGTNVGKAFVVPTIQSQVSIFSYDDNNRVVITRLGDTTYPYTSPTLVADTLLQTGQGYIFGSDYGNIVYRIEGTGRVSVIQSSGGWGADFMPLGYALGLPDLAVSQNDISFNPPDSVYKTGDHIQISVTVHNQGTLNASNVSVVLYDGNPDVGVAPPVGSFQAPLVAAGGSYTGTVTYVVPSNVRYHSIYVKVDPNNTIAESNESNNAAYRPLKSNLDLMPPIAVNVTAPGALGIENSLLSPNPFIVHADFFNTGTVDAEEVRIRFFMYNGLTIDSGSVDTTVSTIPAQGAFSMTWKVLANKDSSGLNLYTIEISGTNVELKDINRGVVIPDLVPPAAPLLLKATSPATGQVMLTWTPNTEKDLSGYKIYYSSAATGFSGTDANEGSSPIIVSTIDTFYVSGLTGDKTYRFAISAFDLSTNESALSNEASVLVLGVQNSHWTINIHASAAGIQDTTSYAGADAKATNGFDSTFDLPKPPKPPSSFVYVYFPHSEWATAVGPDFLADMKLDTNLTSKSKVWTFAVATDQNNQTMSLSFLLSASVPWAYSVKLMDMKSDSVQDLRAMSTYTYNTGTDTVHMFQIIVGGPISLSYTYGQGWSMAGLPLKAANPLKESIFGTDPTTYLYGYSTDSGYFVSNTFNLGQGYWLGALSPVTAMSTGVQVMDSVGVSLNPGFNIISLPYFVTNYSKHALYLNNGVITVSMDSAVTLNWVSPVLYSYLSTAGNYSTADTLIPWNGYWLAAIDSSLRLIFQPPVNSSESISISKQKLATSLKKTMNIAVSDSNWYVNLALQSGNSLDKLGGFGVAANAKAGFDAAYDLPHPPNPPSANYVYLAFPHPEWESIIGPNFSADVRPVAQSANWKIIVGSSTYPANTVLTWDSSSVPKGVSLVLTDFNNSSTRILMEKTGTYRFTLNGSDSLLVSSTITGVSQQAPFLPLTYALRQNYPNPFNPSTIISFDIPKQSLVKIIIYDILGRQVRTLVDEKKSPGRYQVKFDASALSSGVYFYRITADSYIETKKLMLIK